MAESNMKIKTVSNIMGRLCCCYMSGRRMNLARFET
jgi:hypothetical protein